MDTGGGGKGGEGGEGDETAQPGKLKKN